jgi:hypothetical protein
MGVLKKMKMTQLMIKVMEERIMKMIRDNIIIIMLQVNN